MANGLDITLDVKGDWEKSFSQFANVVGQAKAKTDALGASLNRVKIGADGAVKGISFKMPAAPVAPKVDDILAPIAMARGSQQSPQGMIGDVLFGTLGAAAIQGAIGLITSGIGALKNGLMEAASLQTQSIARSSDIGTNLGINLKAARELHNETQMQVADIAAALPGVTKDYNAILDGISPAISSAFQGNAKGYQDAILDVTKRTGVLAATSHADPTMAGSGLNRFISGTSGFQEVMMIDVFQKNAQFQKGLRDGLTQLGVSTEDWKNLTTQQRLKITQDALKIATPDTLLKEFEGTAESIIQNWQTSLFDPLKGAFGALRKVQSAGGRTALDAFTGSLKAVEGLFNTFQAKTGIKIDPMAAVISALDWLSGLARKASIMISKFQGFDFGRDLGTAIGAAIEWVSNLSVKTGADFLGPFLNNIRDNLANLIASVNWPGVGVVVGELVARGFGVLGMILSDPRTWVSAINLLAVGVTAAMGFLAGLVVGVLRGLGETLASVMGRALDNLKSAISFIEGMIAAVVRAVSSVLSKLPGMGGGSGQIVQGIKTGAAIASVGSTVAGLSGTLGLGGQLKGLDPVQSSSTAGGPTIDFKPTLNVSAQSNADPRQIAKFTMGQLGDMYNSVTAGAF